MTELQDSTPRNTIGGTDISAILGCNPYKSAFGLYQRLIGEAQPVPDNAAMQRGRRWENILAKIFEEEWEDQRVIDGFTGVNEVRLKHPNVEYLTGSPDRLYRVFGDHFHLMDRNDFGLEIKTADISQKQLYDFSDANNVKIPDHYYMQCQWYAGLANVDQWDFIVGFFKGDKMVSHESCSFVFNEELYESMVEAAVDFWENNVLKRNPPQDALPAEMETYYRRTYPQHVTGKWAERTDETDYMVRSYLERQEQIRRWEEIQQGEKSRIIGVFGDCEALESELGNVSFKKNKDSEKTDYKAIVESLSSKFKVQSSKWDSESLFTLLSELCTQNTTIVTGPRVLRFPRI